MEPIRRSLSAMGTTMELITVSGGDPRRVRLEGRLEAAAGWIRTADAVLSRFRPDSELARLNRAAGSPCWVSPLLLDVLEAALAAARETGGLYDPTVLPCVQAAGYTAGLPEVLAGLLPAGEPAPGWQPAWQQVSVDRRFELVTLPPGAALDFGGIAKGWAADAICAAWREEEPLVVDAGGDLRVYLPAGSMGGWPVAVADPFVPERDLALLRLPTCGIATSSTVGRRWLSRRGPRHHIIDPRTGMPSESDLAQATVIAPTATAAEAWAKALCILGSEAGAGFLSVRPESAALMVRHDGTCLATPNLEVYLDEFHGEQISA